MSTMLLPDLWPHQAEELHRFGAVDKRALFWSPRVGKTREAVECLMQAFPRLNIQRAVVACPLVMAPRWVEALEAFGLPVIRGYELPVSKLVPLLRGGERMGLNRPHGIVVINQDKLARTIAKGSRTKLADVLLSWGVQAYIRDESHRDKDPHSEMGKASRKIAAQARWVRILTGTPTPNHYGDLWGQVVQVDKSWGSWSEFRGRYLICDAMFPSRVLGHINVEELQTRLLACASLVRREDVFGPDSWQTVVREVDLPATARTLYERLAHEWIAELDASGAQVVRADHVLKRLVRLQQVTSGFVPDDTGEIHNVHTAKLDAVMADLDEIVASREKAVLFHRFRWESATYSEALKRMKVPVYTISGDTPVGERDRIVRSFASDRGGAVVIAQTQAAGVGISLAEATHALFISQGFSFSDEEQARDRIYKPGAARCATYYRARASVDGFIADIIHAKESIHEAVTRADIELMVHGRLHRSRKKIA